jgi:hypothetical protein
LKFEGLDARSPRPDVLCHAWRKARRLYGNTRDFSFAILRGGEAARAFPMKRDDGTAELVDGDYDQVVERIADLYIACSYALAAQDPALGVTITTLINADAVDISLAIRERLKVGYNGRCLTTDCGSSFFAKSPPQGVS